MPICKTCNKDRTNEYFYSTINFGKRYYVTKKCKLCKGVKVRDKFSFKPERLNEEYDIRKQYLLLLRLQINNGLATERDIVNLISCYSEIFGDSVPIFAEINDEYVFMYEKLKEFSTRKKEVKKRPMKRIINK